MTTPKELYKALASDFKSEKRYYFADRGEGMMQGREKSTDRIFLVNKIHMRLGNLSQPTVASHSGMLPL